MDGYSRLIALLKVLLPLIALGILSTLFLLSRDRTPEATIPFADEDIVNRMRDQQVTGPFYSGMTDGGDRVALSASILLTADGLMGENEAKDLSAQIDTIDGIRVNLLADQGTINVSDDLVRMSGSVVVTTSTGFRLESDLLIGKLETLHVHSPGPVDGYGPFGTLNSGAMLLEQHEGQGNLHLFFTNGVKLLYRPKG